MTGWVGWLGLASALLYLAGFFHIVAGLAALINDKAYVVSNSSLWIFDITQWGWIHIFGGIIALVAASSLMKGHVFGRTIAVVVAMLSAVTSMAFIPTYPIWSILIIVMDVLVIIAAIAHGGELKVS